MSKSGFGIVLLTIKRKLACFLRREQAGAVIEEGRTRHYSIWEAFSTKYKSELSKLEHLARVTRGFICYSPPVPISGIVQKRQILVIESAEAAILAARTGINANADVAQDFKRIDSAFYLNLLVSLICKGEGLDEYRKIDDIGSRQIGYSTKYGIRSLSINACCLFEVFRNGEGFAQAEPLQYRICKHSNDYPDGTMIINCLSRQQFTALGYADSIKLPYYLATESDDYPIRTLVVDVDNLHKENLALASYANAVPLAVPLTYNIRYQLPYVKDLNMLDTDYAQILAEKDGKFTELGSF